MTKQGVNGARDYKSTSRGHYRVGVSRTVPDANIKIKEINDNITKKGMRKAKTEVIIHDIVFNLIRDTKFY